MIAAEADNGLHETWTVERCKPSGKGEKVRLRNSVTGELSGWAQAVLDNHSFTIYQINVGGGSVFPDTSFRDMNEDEKQAYIDGDAIRDDETTREEHDEVAEVINMPSPAQDAKDMELLKWEEHYSWMTVAELKDALTAWAGYKVRGLSKMKKAELVEALLTNRVDPNG